MSQVGWNYLDFTHQLTKFKPSKKNLPGQFRNVQLFRTKFVNSSNMQQEYTFRTERQTKSSCSISIQKGFTIGGALNLEFALPTENQPVTEDVSTVQHFSFTKQSDLWILMPRIGKVKIVSCILEAI